MKKIIKDLNNEKGFTLFVAILITGTLLLISMAIISLSVKEAFLSSSARESQYAFYAADTGTECALYWDVSSPNGYSAFGTSTNSIIYCLGSYPSITRSAIVNNNGTSTFRITFPSEPYCADVSVAKTSNGGTKIESFGYNTCVESNPRRVQRAVRVTY